MSTPINNANTPKFGEFKAKVLSIAVSLSTDQPAIFTRLSYKDGTVDHNITHAIRFSKKNGEPNVDAIRIGFDELRSAFPAELAKLNDEALLTYLIEKTDTLMGKELDIGIEAQTKNGIAQKGANGTPYFNVRLRSAVRNLSHATAADLAKSMLTRAISKAAVNKEFAAAS